MQAYKEFFLLGRDGRLSVPLVVASCRQRGKNAIIAFTGISRRSQLDALLGALLLVEKKALPKLADDQFYWCHYMGRPVITESGRKLGVVRAIFNNGAQDILVVRRENAEEEILIPVTAKTLVDDTQEALIVDPPPGLLEINQQG